MDAQGFIRFPDGDWAKLAVSPTFGQTMDLLDAFLLLTEDGVGMRNMPRLMFGAIVALLEGGKLTPRDGGVPIDLTVGADYKLTPDAIGRLVLVDQASKIRWIWAAVQKIREEIPDPNPSPAK
jgi:hypothetical protein